MIFLKKIFIYIKQFGFLRTFSYIRSHIHTYSHKYFKDSEWRNANCRNQDDKEAIKRRMLAYSKDIEHKKDYDHVLINDNVEKCFNELKVIISKNLKKN